MIILAEHLEQPLKAIAEQKQQTVEQLLTEIVENYLKDYYDTQLKDVLLDSTVSSKAEN